MNGMYILDEQGVPQECDDLLAWGRWMATADRHVGDTMADGVRVSTVFLGVDHAFFFGPPPLLYETMVFGGPLDGEQERYVTRDAAIAGHALMVSRVFPPTTP